MGGVEEFWRWFAENAPRFAAIPGEMEKPDERGSLDRLVNALNEVNRELRRVDRGLRAEMSLEEPDGRCELVISADGVAKRIPKVVAVVAAAPHIEGWRVVAFRRRRLLDEDGEPARLSYEGREFDAAEMRFVARRCGGQVDLAVYGLGLSRDDERGMNAVFLMLEGLLGEYDVMTKVGHIDLIPLPESGEVPGGTPLTDIADAVDSMLRKKGEGPEVA